MKSRTKITLASLLSMVVLLFAGTAGALAYSSGPSDRDIKMCVAEIGARLDYGDAEHVRHKILSMKRRTVGYALDIDTTVYDRRGGSVMREYRSVCIATGGNKPSRLNIETLGS